MKTSKKFIAGVSALVVAVSSVAITVSAVTENEGLTISVSSTSANVQANETFDVTVDLANVPDPGIAGCEFAVYYDASAVEVVGVKSEDLTGAAAAELEMQKDLADTMVTYPEYSCFDYYDNDGKVALWATGLDSNSYWIHEDGTLVTITFKAKEDASGNVEIGVKSILDSGNVMFAAADENGNYYAYDNVSVAGATNVSIGGTDTEPTTTEPTTTEPTTTEPTETEPTTSDSGVVPGDSIILGDVNGDKQVKSNDLLTLKKYLLGLENENAIVFNNSDYNADTKINTLDLLMLKRHLLGLD